MVQLLCIHYTEGKFFQKMWDATGVSNFIPWSRVDYNCNIVRSKLYYIFTLKMDNFIPPTVQYSPNLFSEATVKPFESLVICVDWCSSLRVAYIGVGKPETGWSIGVNLLIGSVRSSCSTTLSSEYFLFVLQLLEWKFRGMKKRLWNTSCGVNYLCVLRRSCLKTEDVIRNDIFLVVI